MVLVFLGMGSIPLLGETVTLLAYPGRTAQSSFGGLYREFTRQTGIEVKVVTAAATYADYQRKLEVALASGDKSDLFFATNAIDYSKAVYAGNAQALDGLARQEKVDLEAIFGRYLSRIEGRVYGVPSSPTLWAVFYNKRIFDQAGVPYPKGPWTWDQYVAVARRLTDPGRRIYGSYWGNIDAYSYVLANQRGVSGYKADGSSNFDHPAFVESVRFLDRMRQDWKIQPSFSEMEAKRMTFAHFLDGNIGMTFVGTWLLGNLADRVNFPRDWNWGIAQAPVPDEKSRNTIGSVSYIMINSQAKNPFAAFRLAVFIGKNQHRFSKELPALAQFDKNDYLKLFADLAQTPGDATALELYDALVDNGLGFRPEKILGPVAAQYKTVILKETAVTYRGERSPEDTCREIKKQVDQLIRQRK